MYSDREKPSQGGSGNSNTGSKGGGGGGPRRPRDVKSRTMHKYTVFDPDVGSRYDFEDEEVNGRHRREGMVVKY
jgi:hypothetical protein